MQGQSKGKYDVSKLRQLVAIVSDAYQRLLRTILMLLLKYN